MSSPTKIHSLKGAQFAQRARQKDSRVDEVSKGMEKMFVKYLMDELRKSNAKVDIFGAKKNDFFEDSLYDEYAKLISERGDFGLAKEIKAQILKTRNGGR